MDRLQEEQIRLSNLVLSRDRIVMSVNEQLKDIDKHIISVKNKIIRLTKEANKGREDLV